jgi:outer membrane protein TolC
LPDFDVNIWATNTRNKGNYSYYSYYDKNDFGLSLEFEYPLGGNSSNEYNLLEAELGLKKQYIDYQDDTHDLIESIQELQEELLLYAKNIDSFTLEIQNTSVENERDNYQKGSGDIKFVLDEIIDFYNLQFDYLDEQKQYHQARIEYDSKLDRLIDSRIKCDFCQSNLGF